MAARLACRTLARRAGAAVRAGWAGIQHLCSSAPFHRSFCGLPVPAGSALAGIAQTVPSLKPAEPMPG